MDEIISDTDLWDKYKFKNYLVKDSKKKCYCFSH